MPSFYQAESTALKSLTVFRPVADIPALQALSTLLTALSNPRPSDYVTARQAYANVLYLVRESGFKTLSDLLQDHLKYDDSAFGRACAQNQEDPLFLDAAKKDIAMLDSIATLSFPALKAAMAACWPEYSEELLALPELAQGAPITLEPLLDSFRHGGVGIFARGRAFLWEDGALTMVRNPDHIDYADMIGYTWQRQEVLDNTRRLLDGYAANNVLLHGDSGTGKSATIKSLINIPEFYNLRIIEVSKSSLNELTSLVRLVSGHTQKFILYIDDLTFEKEDRGYSALKTALEGGLENRPANVAIYATSNRRHLIRETFDDRQGSDIHREETIQERASLSERFGLRIPYLSLGKPEFLSMVRQLAEHEHLALADDVLEHEASVWEIQHGGRTPRVARQLMDYLHAKYDSKSN